MTGDAARDAGRAEAEILASQIAAPRTGDRDGLVGRGPLRVGTVFQPDLVSRDQGDQRGLVVGSHTGTLHAQIIGGPTVRRDRVLNTGGAIARAVRKDSPAPLAALNGSVKTAAQGMRLGTMMAAKYISDTRQFENAKRPEGRTRLRETVERIRTHGGKYRFDEIPTAAQDYRDSGLDQ